MVISTSGAMIYQEEHLFFKKSLLYDFEKKSTLPLFHAVNPYQRLKKQAKWLKKVNRIPSLKEHFPIVLCCLVCR